MSAPTDVGAVDLAECPSRPGRCKCGLCQCGYHKHMAVHGPRDGHPPGGPPWDHEFAPSDPEASS